MPIWGGSNYPLVLDNYTGSPQVDNVDTVWADHPNSLAAAIEAIQSKLSITGGVATGFGGISLNSVAANPGGPTVPTLWVDNSSGSPYPLMYTDNAGTDFDLTAGVGYLWNDIYTASMISIDAAGRFKLGRFVTLGPHISYVNLKPTWNGISSVDLEDTNGLIPGICFTVGGKKLAFSVNLDYLLNASFGIETSNGWMTNDDTLDISGFLLQLGTIFRF